MHAGDRADGPLPPGVLPHPEVPGVGAGEADDVVTGTVDAADAYLVAAIQLDLPPGRRPPRPAPAAPRRG